MQPSNTTNNWRAGFHFLPNIESSSLFSFADCSSPSDSCLKVKLLNMTRAQLPFNGICLGKAGAWDHVPQALACFSCCSQDCGLILRDGKQSLVKVRKDTDIFSRHRCKCLSLTRTVPESAVSARRHQHISASHFCSMCLSIKLAT